MRYEPPLEPWMHFHFFVHSLGDCDPVGTLLRQRIAANIGLTAKQLVLCDAVLIAQCLASLPTIRMCLVPQGELMRHFLLSVRSPLCPFNAPIDFDDPPAPA